MRRLAALCLLLALAGPARADPALFVHGGGAPPYLFGSIYVLRPGLPWRTPRLARVLKAAANYWFETTDQPGPAMLLKLVAGMDLFHPLHTLLAPEDDRPLTEKLGMTRQGGMMLVDHMLVTVGAAHLVGPEGLPALLKQRGCRIQRLQ